MNEIIEKEIIIIDNYAGKELLDILKDLGKKCFVVNEVGDKYYLDRILSEIGV